MLNGKPVWRAVRTLVENRTVDGKQVKYKRQIKGTGVSVRVAETRLDEAYKRYLVRTGEADPRILSSSPGALDLTFGEYLDAWLKKVEARGKVQVNTLARYKGAVENHIKPHIGFIPIRLLDKRNVENLLYNILPAKKVMRKNKNGELVVTAEPLLGNSPMRKVYDLLHQSLEEAVNDNIIVRSPMATIPRITKTEPKDEGFDRLTWLPGRIMERLHGTSEATRWVLAFYGLRQGERLGIEWSSFMYLGEKDKTTQLMVNRQLVRDEVTGNLYIKKSTKTRAGKRIIPIPSEVSNLFVEWRKQQNRWKKSPKWKNVKGLENIVFTTDKGKPISHQSDNKQWHSLLNTLFPELPAVRGHALRHLTATVLAKSGTHPQIAKLILGHSDELMSLYYTHMASTDAVQPIEALTDTLLKDWRKLEMNNDGASVEDLVEAEGEELFDYSAISSFASAVIPVYKVDANKDE